MKGELVVKKAVTSRAALEAVENGKNVRYCGLSMRRWPSGSPAAELQKECPPKTVGMELHFPVAGQLSQTQPNLAVQSGANTPWKSCAAVRCEVVRKAASTAP
jgi:hypothetical protein